MLADRDLYGDSHNAITDDESRAAYLIARKGQDVPPEHRAAVEAFTQKPASQPKEAEPKVNKARKPSAKKASK